MGRLTEAKMAEWREARKLELTALPDKVRDAAHIYDNGEVSWPNDDAEAAVNAIAEAGFLILGLDARRHFPDGGVQETPVSDYGIALRYTKEQGLHNADEPRVEPTVEARREAALESLPFAFEEGDYVLITYTPPGGDDAKHGIV